MTDKRFELMSDDEVIIDNCSIVDDGGKQTYWIVEYGQRVKVVELLNELHEENQSSKEFIEQLQQELVLFKKAGADMGIDLNAQITALKKENGQLKRELQRIYDVATLNKAIDVLENKYDKMLSDGSDEVKDAMRHTVLRCIEDLDELKDDITAR